MVLSHTAAGLDHGDVFLSNVTVANCTAFGGDGGGVYMFSSEDVPVNLMYHSCAVFTAANRVFRQWRRVFTVRLDDVVVANNSAPAPGSNGGGLFVGGGGDVRISRSRIVANSATTAG
jgi:hypothetical protein